MRSSLPVVRLAILAAVSLLTASCATGRSFVVLSPAGRDVTVVDSTPKNCTYVSSVACEAGDNGQPYGYNVNLCVDDLRNQTAARRGTHLKLGEPDREYERETTAQAVERNLVGSSTTRGCRNCVSVHGSALRCPNDNGEGPEASPAVNAADQDEPTAGALFVEAQKSHYGEGAPRDILRAAELYRDACDRDLAQACYELALLYQSSRKLTPTPEQGAALSRQYFEAGCALDSARACAALAELREAERDNAASSAPETKTIEQ